MMPDDTLLFCYIYRLMPSPVVIRSPPLASDRCECRDRPTGRYWIDSKLKVFIVLSSWRLGTSW